MDRVVLFEDVKLQMDSKLWAEEFNRHYPPKKIDIFQVCILEFHDESEHAFYYLERFIEGEYIKYNSNSSFVSDICRKIPQAFSHFTFERSGHQLIVVDIQGVGDLYTDPQIHILGLAAIMCFYILAESVMACFYILAESVMACFYILAESVMAYFNKEIQATGEGYGNGNLELEFTDYKSNIPTSVCSSLVEERGDAMEELRRRRNMKVLIWRVIFRCNVWKYNSSNDQTEILFSTASSFCDEHSTDTQCSDMREQIMHNPDKLMVKARFTSSYSSNLCDSGDSERIAQEAEKEAY
ncbi:unnamed protein product [Litomosoides sigmodontis]|uniref:Alpha-type protein kinase domain-containing protein n=1 Tax=Litomosoides sigmodontis TaxID=42156 RepID=A0A3P6V0P4_LITSI|nr:unnamed protein product [Litomosoides sigmodontis]